MWPGGLSRSARFGGRLLLGEASLGGVALIGDAAEGIFDRQLVERGRIVIVQPFLGFGMVGVIGVGGGVERLVKAGDAATILGRRVALARDVAGIGEIGITGTDIADGE